MRLVVICALPDERDAVLQGLGATSQARLPAYPQTLVAHPGAGTVVAICAGSGPAAAVAAGVAANRLRPDVLLSMGLARGLAAGAPTGTIAVADRIVGADLGTTIPPEGAQQVGRGVAGGFEAAAEPDFRSLETLGLGHSAYDVSSPLLDAVSGRLETTESPVRVGPLLSAATMPGSVQAREALLRRHPQAVAVAREGFGVAVAAAAHGLPVFEVRVTSELAGTAREVEGDIPALDALAQAASALFARDWEEPATG